METQIIDAAGTQVITEGTQLVSGSTTETGANFTGGLLQIHEKVSGWEVKKKLHINSGEADIYIADKDGKPGIIKYYRSVTKPKTEILDKLKELHHPDIVDVYDFGIYNDRFYEIMEYAEGGALDTRKDDEKRSYRYLPLSEEETIGICKEVIDSFKTCHEMGIIHRDIKPANIYFRHVEEIDEVDEDGKERKRYKGSDAVIADFGISSIMDEAEQLHKTRTGSRTTGYAAPEVLSGLISPKMDYYALGITLWELLTGKDPFTTENGKRRNDAHLIRDTIEGRMADDILSKEPRVSQNMERLIRGLLVIDPEHRWGYDEVTRHLAGETVEVYQRAKKDWTFSIGEIECTTLEALGSALIDNVEVAKNYIFRRRHLRTVLEDNYPDIAKKIEEIAEESSANKDENNGVFRVAYLLNPGIPFKADNGFKAQNIDDIIYLLENAPESLLPLFRDHRSKIYTWFEIIGNTDLAEEIKKLPTNISNTEFAGKTEVLLKNKVIKPFKLEKYKDFELSTLDQLRKVPGDMQRHILALVKEKSYEGLFLPWLYITMPNVSVNNIDTSSWGNFIMCIT
jgi:serine/threonine protein kinase